MDIFHVMVFSGEGSQNIFSFSEIRDILKICQEGLWSFFEENIYSNEKIGHFEWIEGYPQEYDSAIVFDCTYHIKT